MASFKMWCDHPNYLNKRARSAYVPGFWRRASPFLVGFESRFRSLSANNPNRVIITLARRSCLPSTPIASFMATKRILRRTVPHRGLHRTSSAKTGR